MVEFILLWQSQTFLAHRLEDELGNIWATFPLSQCLLRRAAFAPLLRPASGQTTERPAPSHPRFQYAL